jgi:NADH:ubiquinone oxidoreductase subunit K
MRIVSGIIVFALGIYGLITDNNAILPFMMFFLGIMSLVMGISELSKKRKSIGFVSILAAAFIFLVLIRDLLR